MNGFQKTVLSNGVRIVSERHSRSQSVSMGLFVDVGTRDESLAQAGASHFLEHLVFKGTKNRSAFQIAKALEELGGDLNAFTTKEYTCYHALVLKNHWKIALDVLADLACGMDLTQTNFDLEKSVVMQEIAMSSDSPEDKIFDDQLAGSYAGHSLGRPILGNIKSLKAMTRGSINKFYRSRYSGQQLILSVAGNVDHDKLVKEAEKFLGHIPANDRKNSRRKPKVKSFSQVLKKTTDQVHMLWGWEATSFRDPLRFESFIVNSLLGGGMTSRLFQSVREKKGLAYNIYSSLFTFTDSGLMMIYSSAEPAQMKEIGKTVAHELKKLKANGLPPHDLKLFKTQVKGQILLGSDDMENRMNSLGVNEMVLGRYKSVAEVVDEIEAISTESIQRYVDKHLSFKTLGGTLLAEKTEGLKSWWEDNLASIKES